MKEIKRYHTTAPAGSYVEADTGYWCRWSDVEALQKELQETRALALAAFKLIPEDENVGTLRSLAKEASEVFAGEDKKTIAKLREELREAYEAMCRMNAPPPPGVSTVFARDPSKNVDYPLTVFRITHTPGGGLEIGVYLP